MSFISYTFERILNWLTILLIKNELTFISYFIKIGIYDTTLVHLINIKSQYFLQKQ